MNLYSTYVLPRLIDLAMRNKDATQLRAQWLPHARGDVLEVGVGSGLNLPFYSSQVRKVYGLDPSIQLQRIARTRMPTAPMPIEFLLQSAEDPVPLPDASIDTIVITWTLCSIPNPATALHAIKRVLKADGQLIFVEHGRAPDSSVAHWQDRITPIWKRFTGGCHLNRQVDGVIEGAGFRISELKRCYLPGPRPMTYTYQGFARL